MDTKQSDCCVLRSGRLISTIMSSMRSIRVLLRVSQAELGDALGVTQSNVSFYEKGQSVRPEIAERLIAFARKRGVNLSYDQVYGAAPLPKPAKAA